VRRLILILVAVNLLFVGAAMLGGRTWGEWLVVEFGVQSPQYYWNVAWVDPTFQIEHKLPKSMTLPRLTRRWMSEEGQERLLLRWNDGSYQVDYVSEETTIPIGDNITRIISVDWTDNKVYFRSRVNDTNSRFSTNVFDLDTQTTTHLFTQPIDWEYDRINTTTKLFVFLVSENEPSPTEPKPQLLAVFDLLSSATIPLQSDFWGMPSGYWNYGKFDLHDDEPLVAFIHHENPGEILLYDHRVDGQPISYTIDEEEEAKRLTFWEHPEIGTWLVVTITRNDKWGDDIVALRLDTSQMPPTIKERIQLSEMNTELSVDQNEAIASWREGRPVLVFNGIDEDNKRGIYTIDLTDKRISQIASNMPHSPPAELLWNPLSEDSLWVSVPDYRGVQLYNLENPRITYNVDEPFTDQTTNSFFIGWASPDHLD
jgi:hypothetical protein